jgi:tetratricopeptide (TPR) repeat protein
MYTILLSLLLGILAGVGLRMGDLAGPVGSAFAGFGVAVVAYGVAAWRLRRALTGHMTAIQQVMLAGQKQLQQRVNLLQTRPTGSPAQMMKELEKMQRQLIGQALEATKALDPYKPWIPLMSRQIATMRMQFHYQMQEFDKVDELLPRCLLLEPIGMSMKLAQMYRRKLPLEDQRKYFDRCTVRLKYNQSALLYSLMAWILLQERQEEEAHKVLVTAAKNNENDTIKRNLERLANNRAREFSNAGLGDEWYALFLEQPKVTMRRQQARPDGRPF